MRLTVAYTFRTALAALFVIAVAAGAGAQQPEPLSQGSLPEPPAAEKDWSVLPLTDEDMGGSGPEEDETDRDSYTGDEYFTLAEDSYEMGDFERARDYYIKAVGLLKDGTTLAKAHERLAFIYAAFGEQDKVFDEFVSSLKLDPSLMLDPELVSPKVYEAFVKARDEVVREGILVVNSDPPGAEVFLEGESIGEAPVRKEHVKEGDYALRLVKTGYEVCDGSVTIKKDVTLTVDEKLIRARGSLSVTTSPPGVQVVFDGRSAGTSPIQLENVSGGTHTVSLKREYFEPFEVTVELEKGEAASFSAELKRRILLIDDGDAPDFMQDRISGMKGISVVSSGLAGLRAGLVERGLDPASIGFLLERKTALSLEDAAVLSGIMEDARVELALLVLPRATDEGPELGLALYSTASVFADKVTLRAKDEDGLSAEFGRFIEMWRAVTDPYRPSTGLRLVDRMGGGVEVISVTPGYPGTTAGLLAGDVITTADGSALGGKSDFERLIGAGGVHEISYVRGGKKMKAEIGSAVSPVETPVDSGLYLYNLALVQFSGYLENVPTPEDGTVDDTRGLYALGLGNVYQRMGEYGKAVKAYSGAGMSAQAGICDGTVLYRTGQAYEKLGLWPEAAAAYRKAMLLYTDATVDNVTGPPVAQLARERLKYMYELGLVKDRWWL